MRYVAAFLGIVLCSPIAWAEPEPEPEPEPAKPARSDEPRGLAFGSYGRVSAATDMRGSTPEPQTVTAHGSRIVENNYSELDFYYYMKTKRDVRVRTVTTLAFKDPLFHYSGEFNAPMAIRNFFAEATDKRGVGGWVGSRLYRGDDVYLLDFWPLDDLNTLGAGMFYRKDRIDMGVHGGVNRLLNPYQYQERDVAAPVQGAQTIVTLDRQRYVASAKATYRVLGDGTGPSVKAKVYGELHSIASGSRVREDDTIENLPKDFGWTLGAQLGAWGFAKGGSHINVFVRFSKGLAAFDELTAPKDFNLSDKTYPNASEFLLATSMNYEFGRGGVMAAGYVRRFADADRIAADRDDGWEYVVDVRPHYALVGDFSAGVDLSYQARFPKGLSPTALVALDPAVFQVAPMLIYAPFGTGSYARPQFRLVYRAANRNEGARDLFALDDPRRSRTWVHYLGLQAEWWFNSTYRGWSQ